MTIGNRKIILAAALVCVPIGCAPADSIASQKHLMDADIQYSPLEGYYVSIENHSDDFLCVDEGTFDTRRGTVALFDSHGQNVPRYSYADPAPNFSLRFDFNQAYYFIRPREARRVAIDIKNFRAIDSRYRYELIIPYYRCDLITDKTRIRAKKSIEELVIHSTGTITLHQKK